MKFVFYILLLVSINNSIAQDTTIFAPSGAKWSYSTFVLVPYPELLTFESEGEILLNDTVARVLKSYQTVNSELQYMVGNDKYIFTSGNKVYHWVEDRFFILFDFGAAPGDTIYSRAADFPISLSCFAYTEEPLDFIYVIDSVGIMNINGVDLRTQYVTNIDSSGEIEWLIENPIVERIGQFAGACFWWGRGPGCLTGGFPGELRCYEDNDILFKNPYTFFDLECDYISTIESVSDGVNSCYPNPTTNFINLPFYAEEINIFSVTGKKISGYTNQIRIDVHDLPPNLYIIEYLTNNTRHLIKFVKI